MEAAVSNRVRLGAFELDLKAGELRTGDRKVRLQEQPFQILLMLVERAGGLVTREEIKKKLWPNDTVVEFDHSIHTAINKLRQAFGDSAENPKYIETVARRGYRLMVLVERVDSRPGQPALRGACAAAAGTANLRSEWQENLPLPCAGTAGWWRHGGGVQGRRSEAGAPRGPEVSA